MATEDPKNPEDAEGELIEEEIELSTLDKLKKTLLSTKFIIWSASVFGLLFLIFIIVQSCAPRKGNILYGMCMSFLELQVPFPDTIQPKEIEFYRKGARIYFTHLDGYGEYRLETIECAFEQDPQKGVQLDSAYFNYVKASTNKERIVGKGRLYAVKQEEIDLFNKSLSPAAILQDIDLSLPDDTIIRAY